MPAPAQLHLPESLEELLALLAEYGEDAKVVAGGTAFTILWKAGLLQVGHVVGCSRLAGLDRLAGVDGGTTIGALVRLRDVERSAAVRRRAPVLAAALGLVANVRVRNVATMGGNLAEADYTSDPPCVLTALGASVRLASRVGVREVPLTEFFVDYFETVLRPEEFLTGVTVPELPGAWGGTYLKFLSRSAEDRTCLGVAAIVRTDDDGRCAGLRLAVGGATPTPLRLVEVEEEFMGQELDGASLDNLAAGYVAAADPVSDHRGSAAYRRRVMSPLIVRAVRRAARGTRDAVFA